MGARHVLHVLPKLRRARRRPLARKQWHEDTVASGYLITVFYPQRSVVRPCHGNGTGTFYWRLLYASVKVSCSTFKLSWVSNPPRFKAVLANERMKS